MIYKFIHDNSNLFSIVKMAKVFKIHKNSYYSWCKSLGKIKSDSDKIIIEIRNIQKRFRYTYGSPRITEHLNSIGYKINHKKVSKILKLNGMNFKQKKKFIKTTDSKHDYYFSPNLLNRNFKVNLPNKVWVSDFTYIWTMKGWLYLCVIIDLYSRKVVGWSVGCKIDTELLLKAFNKAIKSRKPDKNLIFHSDRGVQYCSEKFRDALKAHKMIQSMSRKGNCWDNACAESFFKSLKIEWIYDTIFKSQEDAKFSIFEYIEIFYNRKRLHSTLGYLSPHDFELIKGA